MPDDYESDGPQAIKKIKNVYRYQIYFVGNHAPVVGCASADPTVVVYHLEWYAIKRPSVLVHLYYDRNRTKIL